MPALQEGVVPPLDGYVWGPGSSSVATGEIQGLSLPRVTVERNASAELACG